MTFLGEGNLAGARAVLNAVPKDVGSTELVAYVATANDLVWFSTNSSESFSCGSRRARLTTTGAHGPAA
jgi:hypothetical protein